MSFDLSLTPAHHDLVQRTHAFAEEVIRPAAGYYDRNEEFPWPILERAAEEGFYNPLFYRDLIADPMGLSLPLFMEELFWGCAGIGLAVVMPALALSAMAQSATTEQLLRWAPDSFGEPGDLKMAALCISEPQGGSDVGNLRTRARRDGDDWVIDGHKIWIGNGGIADVHVVNATVDPELGHRGQALFVVPKGTPGLEMVRKLEKLGCRASHTAELRFEGCRVPGDHLLGGEGRLEHLLEKARSQRAEGGSGGGSSTLGTFEQTRPMVAAQALGIARAALEYARDYAVGREAFGEPIIDKQGISFQLADVAADLDAARLLTWRAAWMAARDVPFHHGEGSMSKLSASEVAVRATERAVQICGGWGYVRDLPVEKWYRDAKLYTIFEGTSEIQRYVIGRALADDAGEPPLHHTLPGRRRVAAKTLTRGTKRRARAGMGLIRLSRALPQSVLRIAMIVLSPPRRHRGSTD
jgi:acyl-CoA dehydrogenase